MIFNVGAGNGGSVVYLTQAEYDALPDSKLTNNIEYRITDGDTGVATASNLSYDNSFSDLEAVTVQQAVDEVNNNLNGLIKTLEFTGTTSTTGSFVLKVPSNAVVLSVKSGEAGYYFTPFRYHNDTWYVRAIVLGNASNLAIYAQQTVSGIAYYI